MDSSLNGQLTDTSKLAEGKIPCEETGIEVKKSLCSICDSGAYCGIDLYVKNGEIIKVEGTLEHMQNRGTLCPKGAATRQYVYSSDRLKTPLRRIGKKGEGKFEEISWDEAYAVIAGKLREAKSANGPESVAFYVGYPKWMRPFVQRLSVSYGSPNYCSESSTCNKAMMQAWKLVFGTGAMPDMRNTNCSLIWSGNPMHSNTPMAEPLIEKKNSGMKLIVVDPRLTPTAALADIHLQLRPGTDGALALGIANVIVGEGLFDKDFIGKYSFGFEQYKEYIKDFTPEKTSALTGVPADKIVSAARMYATVKPAAFFPSSQAVVHHTNGVQNYRAIMMLVGLTGNFDVPGGNTVPSPLPDSLPLGFESMMSEFNMPKPWSEMKPRIGQDRVPVWCELIDEAQAVFMPDHIIEGRPYPVKTVIGFGMNHRMWPDSKRMERALSELDFFVNLEVFMTDTNKYADIVLPVCTTVERGELKSYPGGFVMHTQPVIKPLYDSISDLEFVFEIAKRLELDDELLLNGYDACVDFMLEPTGITMDELMERPSGLVTKGFKPPTFRKYESKGFRTPSGKMEFVSGVISKYDNLAGHDALPVYYPPGQSSEATPEMFEEYPFIINTGSRLPMFVHTRTYRLPWLNALRPKPAADINPADAGRLGVKQGDTIRISTPTGEISVLANISDMALEGAVFMYHGNREADVNRLISGDYLDPLSGYPGFKSFLGKIEKAG